MKIGRSHALIEKTLVYLLRPCRWEPDKSKDTAARARSSCVRPSKNICRAPTRPRARGTLVSAERWNSGAARWPLWVNLHRRLLVVSAATWIVVHFVARKSHSATIAARGLRQRGGRSSVLFYSRRIHTWPHEAPEAARPLRSPRDRMLVRLVSTLLTSRQMLDHRSPKTLRQNFSRVAVIRV